MMMIFLRVVGDISLLLILEKKGVLFEMRDCTEGLLETEVVFGGQDVPEKFSPENTTQNPFAAVDLRSLIHCYELHECN